MKNEKEHWFEFGDSCLIRSEAIDLVSLDGCDLTMVISGFPQVIVSNTPRQAQERYDLIRNKIAGFG